MPKSPTDKRHFIMAAALVAISTVLLDLLLKNVLPLPVQASIEAVFIDQLIGWHFTVIAFLFSLVVVFMLYAVFVFRKRDGDEEDGVHFEGNTTLEVVWTVIPLLAVLVFSFYGLNVLADVTRSAPDEMAIKVNGFQWAWTFEYEEGFVSPELVMPVDQRIHLQMNSIDVIHSFWIPEMRVKQDLVPGHETNLRVTPILEGEYKLRCSELCGLSHWSMLAPVRVVSQAEYDAWVSEQVAALDSTTALVDNTQAAE